MKAIANRRSMLAALTCARRFEEKGPKLPLIASCVLLRCDTGSIELTARVGFCWYRTTVAGDVLADGDATVLAATLREIIKASSQVDLELEARGDHLLLRVGGGHCDLVGLNTNDVADYFEVPFPATGAEHVIDLPFPLLRRMLAKVLHAIPASDKEGRAPSIALLRLAGDRLHLSATDGHRAIVVSCAVGGDGGESIFQIPVDVIPRLLAMKADCSCRVLASDSYLRLILASGESVTFRCAELSSFPEIGRFTQGNGAARAVVDRHQLLAAVLRARASQPALSPAITLRTASPDAPLGESVCLIVESPLGSYLEHLAACLDGSGGFAVNATYLAEALEAIDADEVTLDFGETDDRIYLEPMLSGRSSEHQREVVMPMTVDSNKGAPDTAPPAIDSGAPLALGENVTVTDGKGKSIETVGELAEAVGIKKRGRR